MRSLRFFKVLVATSVFALLFLAVLLSTWRRLGRDEVELKSVDILGLSVSPVTQTEPTAARLTPSLTATISRETANTSPTRAASISPSDVVLILKTGSSSVWRRLPLHLLTTFANGQVPNYAIYSDAQERLPSGIETIDTIANVSNLIREHDPKAYRIYTTQNDAIRPNQYREQVGLPGDTTPVESEDGNPEGWVLDRYKFLPMLTHAYENWPDAKWYIYIEDDTYIFWNNILQWLSRQSSDHLTYHGAISGPSNATFAQGGSGIAFSQALMAHVFASDRMADLETYANLTARSCCGDMILGDILRDYNIKVNGGEFGTLLFRPEPPWKTRFDVSVWCDPVMTFHHLHQQDIAQLQELQDDLTKEGRPKVLFRDVYMKLIDPYLIVEQFASWDNYADLYVLTPNGIVPAALQDESLNVHYATSTSAGCQQACLNSTSCYSWRHTLDACALDTGIKFGRPMAPNKNGNVAVTSGWMLSRLNETLLSNECWGFRD